MIDFIGGYLKISEPADEGKIAEYSNKILIVALSSLAILAASICSFFCAIQSMLTGDMVTSGYFAANAVAGGITLCSIDMGIAERLINKKSVSQKFISSDLNTSNVTKYLCEKGVLYVGGTIGGSIMSTLCINSFTWLLSKA